MTLLYVWSALVALNLITACVNGEWYEALIWLDVCLALFLSHTLMKQIKCQKEN